MLYTIAHLCRTTAVMHHVSFAQITRLCFKILKNQANLWLLLHVKKLKVFRKFREFCLLTDPSILPSPRPGDLPLDLAASS